MPAIIKIGTRGSELALWQANHVADLLHTAYPDTTVEIVTFTTKGDTIQNKSLPEIGGKGLFTEELERALLADEIDCAVHSLKDLPTEQPKGLVIGAVPKRGAVEDVLISKHNLTLDKLPQGAKIGTSSLRRAAQLRHYRSDFEIIDLRGNVPTRIAKALNSDGEYDAIVLAQAGVERLGMMDKVTQVIPLEIMLPAPRQGAIGVQCRNSKTERNLFDVINHVATHAEISAEHTFLHTLEAGCSMPVACYGKFYFNKEGLATLDFTARILDVSGSSVMQLAHTIVLEYPENSSEPGPSWSDTAGINGSAFAYKLLKQGADKILAEVKNDIAE